VGCGNPRPLTSASALIIFLESRGLRLITGAIVLNEWLFHGALSDL
jgi:hypothetical protein